MASFAARLSIGRWAIFQRIANDFAHANEPKLQVFQYL